MCHSCDTFPTLSTLGLDRMAFLTSLRLSITTVLTLPTLLACQARAQKSSLNYPSISFYRHRHRCLYSIIVHPFLSDTVYEWALICLDEDESESPKKGKESEREEVYDKDKEKEKEKERKWPTWLMLPMPMRDAYLGRL
jgi:hypothetical protein